jgi:hypothetical protein
MSVWNIADLVETLADHQPEANERNHSHWASDNENGMQIVGTTRWRRHSKDTPLIPALTSVL